jgi:hypothetical protein
LAEGFGARDIAVRLDLSERAVAGRIRVIFAKLGVANRRQLRAKMDADAWRRDLQSIREFIETHGHSRIPESWRDKDGRSLYILLSNIRRHHAGRSWLGEGRPPKGSGPYPYLDYAADLDRLEGWSWEIETPSKIPLLRSTRSDSYIIRALGLNEGVSELAYIRSLTAALREDEDPPWPRLRELLAAGVDVRRSILADFFPGHHQSCFLGVLLTPARKALAFCLLFSGAPDSPEAWLPMKLNEWRELPTTDELAPYREQIALGAQLLEQEAPDRTDLD